MDMMYRTIVSVLLVLVLRSELVNAAEIRVMSFNIRYGTAKDGENVWDNRDEFVVETIRNFGPDLLGTQETLKFQRDFLVNNLPEYDCLGAGRDDGKDRGEMTPVFYRRDRFKRLDGGHFWLSETPEAPGSRSWDSSLPRMVTWVRLLDRMNPESVPIVFVNTHFDHRGREARRRSAELLRNRTQESFAESRVIITGDFNASVDSEPYSELFGAKDGKDSPFVDTYRLLNKQSEREGTFSGFTVSNDNGSRIDWIAVTRDLEVRSATIDRTARNGRTPSDHFPVTAVVKSATP